MKKTLLLLTIALLSIFNSCKKENTKEGSSTEFSIIGYWLPDGKITTVFYDKDDKIISTEEEENRVRVNLHFKNDGKVIHTLIDVDENNNNAGYVKDEWTYEISNKTERGFALSIIYGEDGKDEANVEIITNDKIKITSSEFSENNDGIKYKTIISFKKAPANYVNPAGN